MPSTIISELHVTATATTRGSRRLTSICSNKRKRHKDPYAELLFSTPIQ